MEGEKVMTKRKRSSSSKRAEKEEREEWETANRMFPSLPSHIVMNILSRLPLKSQLICKSNLNFSSTNKPYFLFKTINTRGCSRKLSLIDFNNAHQDLEIKLEFKPKINIPDKKFEFVSSCNGLLCLSPAWGCESTYICNPVSGEDIRLSFRVGESSFIGFGFSPKTKQYKVLRLGAPFRFVEPFTYVLHVYSIAKWHSGRWSRLKNVPSVPGKKSFNAFLNGALHWVDCDPDSSVFIYSFDFDDEQFKVVPPPVHFGADQKKKSDFTNVGVLRDRLYITDVASEDHFDIWVMKDYGVGESWIKVFTVRNLGSRDHFEPIMIMKTGEILMIVDKHALVYYDPILEKFTNLGMRGMKSKFEALAYFPSLTSLVGFSS